MNESELIIACTLNPDLVRERVEEWTQVVAQADSIDALPEGVRLGFLHRGAQGLADLAEAEHECCPFFTFVLTISGGKVSLEVTAPPEARPLVDLLLGLDGS